MSKEDQSTSAVGVPLEVNESILDENAAEDEQVAAEGLGDNFRSSPWKQPTKELAYQHQQATTFESGKASICSTGPKQLGGLGEGISLYFYILRYLSCYFFLATILATPHMILALSGNAVVEQYVDPFQLIRLTAINHADVAVIYEEEEEEEETKEEVELGEEDVALGELVS